MNISITVQPSDLEHKMRGEVRKVKNDWNVLVIESQNGYNLSSCNRFIKCLHHNISNTGNYVKLEIHNPFL